MAQQARATADELRRQVHAEWHAGELAAATLSAERLLACAPERAQDWQLAGAVALAAADFDVALARLRRAADLAPADEAIHADLAAALFEARRPADAAAACSAALARWPRSTRLWFTLGAACGACGRGDEAADAYRRALDVDPAHADAAINLAVLLQRGGRLAEALQLYRGVLERQPDHRIGLANCAAALIAARRFEAAVPLLRRVLAAYPDDVFANANLGLGLTESPAFAEGTALLHRAARISGNAAYALKADLAIPPLLASRDEILAFRAGLAQRIERWRQARITLDDPLAAIAKTGFYLAYQGEDDRMLQQKTAELYLHLCPRLRYTGADRGEARLPSGRRIRVAFVSMFLCEHTIGKLFAGLIAGLPRGEFECIVFAPRMAGDPVQEALLRQGVAVVPLPGTLEAARERVVSARPDIVFYPDLGMSPFTYCLAFSRLAPAQFASWGHPVTTGIATIDYFVSHDDCEAGDTRAQYTEALLRLPRGVPYTRYPRPTHRGGGKSRADFALPADRRIYVCPHSLFKLHPDFVAALREILAADDRALLLFVGPAPAAWREVLRQRLAPAADAHNVAFTGTVSQQDFVELLGQGDVLLDSFHFGGGNTTAEALGAGVPIVTLPGALMRGRFTYAWLAHLGLREGIAGSAADYVTRALHLARDDEHNRALRRATRDAAQRLYDDDGACTALAALLRGSLDGSLDAGR